MSTTPEKAAAATTTSPKSSPSKKEVDAATQAMNHFAQGKRHLLVNDINSAVNSLQEACRMLAEQHGETAPECGDAYFYYGRALLEMARVESGVLGNALDGVPEGEDMDSSQVENPDKLAEDEKEKIGEQVGEALEENFKTCEKSSPSDEKVNGHAKENGKSDEPMEDNDKSDKASSDKDNKDSDKDTDSKKKEGSTDDESQDGESQDDAEDGEEEGDEDAAEGEEKEGAEGEEEKEGEGEKTEEEDEDVSNLQLAWEMLELAKVIYQRQEEGNKAMSLKAAQVFLKLGEVGLESENYPQSIEDFQSCLKIQETHMEVDDRCLAESHYQLGVAHSFSDDFDKSIDSFTKATKIIEDRIANLEKRKKEKEGWTEEQKKNDAKLKEDPFYTEDTEIKELNTLLPEIKEKIVDMEEMKQDSKDKINKVKKELGMASAIAGGSSAEGSTNAFGFGSSSSSASDAKPIATMMIKKKRKPEDEAEGDAAKKTKADNGEAKPSENGAESNGKAENGVKNGHSSPEKMDTDKTIKSDASTDELKKKAAADMETKTKELKEQSA